MTALTWFNNEIDGLQNSLGQVADALDNAVDDAPRNGHSMSPDSYKHAPMLTCDNPDCWASIVRASLTQTFTLSPSAARVCGKPFEAVS